ncbi:hypothetical protein FQR65_LT19215 [Abscondita terminalis]|nr:hypothetical protein FQR65_LT19215 [Abscondita terminalis]
MAYIGVEFDDTTIDLISNKWLTSTEKHTFWPPYKTQDLYNRALIKLESPSEPSWTHYEIKRYFFHCDGYENARRKIKLAEVTSDVQSDDDEEIIPKKRRRQMTRKLYESSEDSDQECFTDELTRYKNQKITETSKSFGDLDLTCEQEQVGNTRSQSEIIQTGSTPSTSKTVNALSSLISTKHAQQLQVARSGLTKNDLSLLGHNFPNSVPECGHKSPSTEVIKPSGFGGIIKILLELKEQNKRILAHLEKNTAIDNERGIFLPDDFPNINLKLSVSYLSTIGGKELIAKVNAILRKCVINQLASGYSYLGTRNKKRAFRNLRLNEAVIGAVKCGTLSEDESSITKAIKEWLKHAPCKGLNLRRSNL